MFTITSVNDIINVNIRNIEDKNLIVQGIAGSGKTSAVAKTIVNIPIEDATFAVGGTKYIVPPQADHGTDTWTDLPVESSTPDLPVVNE